MAGFDTYDLLKYKSLPDSAKKYYSEGLIEWAVMESTKIIEGLSQTANVQERFIELWQYAFADGMLVLFYSGRRSFDKQKELYDRYIDYTNNPSKYSKPVFVAARAGYSYHNFGMAVDMMVLTHDGSGQMAGGLTRLNDINKTYGLGLKWGASFNDPNHFQYDKIPISELRATDPLYSTWIQQENPDLAEAQQIEEWKQNPVQPEQSWLQRNATTISAAAVLTLASGLFILVAIMLEKPIFSKS